MHKHYGNDWLVFNYGTFVKMGYIMPIKLMFTSNKRQKKIKVLARQCQ